MRSWSSAALVVALVAGGCSNRPTDAPDGAAPSATPTGLPSAATAVPRARAVPSVREGGALARAVGEPALYVADEDHRAVRRVSLPVGAAAHKEIALEGPPAQVLALDSRVV